MQEQLSGPTDEPLCTSHMSSTQPPACRSSPAIVAPAPAPACNRQLQSLPPIPPTHRLCLAARLHVFRDSLGEVRVWDLGDLRPASIRRLHPLSGGILSLRLFRSGGQQLLGTQGRDGITLLWACGDDLQLSE